MKSSQRSLGCYQRNRFGSFQQRSHNVSSPFERVTADCSQLAGQQRFLCITVSGELYVSSQGTLSMLAEFALLRLAAALQAVSARDSSTTYGPCAPLRSRCGFRLAD
jgi:hypothetical protein